MNDEYLASVRVPRTLPSGLIIEMVYWLQGNVRKYHAPVNGEIVWFQDPQDAVAFKLKFGLTGSLNVSS